MSILNIPIITFFAIILSVICVIFAFVWGLLYRPGDKDE